MSNQAVVPAGYDHIHQDLKLSFSYIKYLFLLIAATVPEHMNVFIPGVREVANSYEYVWYSIVKIALHQWR